MSKVICGYATPLYGKLCSLLLYYGKQFECRKREREWSSATPRINIDEDEIENSIQTKWFEAMSSSRCARDDFILVLGHFLVYSGKELISTHTLRQGHKRTSQRQIHVAFFVVVENEKKPFVVSDEDSIVKLFWKMQRLNGPPIWRMIKKKNE